MDLEKGEEVEITFRPSQRHLVEKVEELDKYLSKNTPKPFVSRLGRGNKWYTEEYYMKKLGPSKE